MVPGCRAVVFVTQPRSHTYGIGWGGCGPRGGRVWPGRVGPDAVSQLNRYVAALDRDLHEGTTVRGVLVAPSVTDTARRLLDERSLAFVSLEP